MTERLFAELLGGSFSAEADRAVIERLMDLAPPGIDELVALLEVTELSAYDALVLDTAPTGHLLRLLEMPDVALAWTHQVLRLLLKYREVIGLGELAERLLALSRELKSLRAMLEDASGAWLLVVALPEALSVRETRRLLPRLREMGFAPGALLVNRASEEGGSRVRPAAAGTVGELTRVAEGVPVAGAPALGAGPRGVDELRTFMESWRRIR